MRKPAVDIERVGVIGAGVMGRGVSIALRQAGLKVILVDRSEEALDRARRQLGDDARMYSLLAPGPAITGDEVRAQINFTTDYQELADADLVIENVTERWEIKKPVYER